MSVQSSQDESSLHSSPADAGERELDEKYPNRPHNHSPTLPFHVLFQDLFDPLNKNRPTKGKEPKRNKGPHAGPSRSEIRRGIIQNFITRWRREVGNDIHPALRLIIPEKDRERAMYGVKEKALGRYLVKIMKIDRNSEDALSLLNWKIPGKTSASRMAGDFPGRCYEVISKRPMLTDVGDMTIEEVNCKLDELSNSAKETAQLPILEEFYRRMNAEELMWLIRIILRQMKVGSTEKTILYMWHPDAETLFNISSSLRRVCWELYDPMIRLEGEDRGVALMECFQPQLAQFQVPDFKKLVGKLKPTEDDDEFWIEEKMDGERMQLHMGPDPEDQAKTTFRYWSRKAKDYTYLYGGKFDDVTGALTPYIKTAFQDGVENIILDGEMITWDPEEDIMVPFGSLKTAALAQRTDSSGKTQRPLFRVFDILFLNDTPLTQYTLRDRRKALERSIKPVHRRLELQEYAVGRSPEDIEPHLHSIIQRASEGLVIKSPRSAYRLNDRNDDWIKVKPEYMDEYGENLDCLVIGGYYGTGHRGGNLSSFLCGLRMDKSRTPKDSWNPQKFTSFCKVGGGFNADDFATIRHLTDGKWIRYDHKKPPTDYIELGGGVAFQRERPDVWIKPEDSFVVEVKASEVTPSDEFGFGQTLRFPRFKRLRQDKNWDTALSTQEFLEVRAQIEAAKKDSTSKKLKPDDSRQKRRKLDSQKRFVTVTGYDVRDVNAAEVAASQGGGKGNVFQGLTFYVMTESLKPIKKSKVELEEMIKSYGGHIVQTHTFPTSSKVKDEKDSSPPPPAVIVCVADRRTVKVASLEKRNSHEIIKPIWLFDCINQAHRDAALGLERELIIPLERHRHIYFLPSEGVDEQDSGWKDKEAVYLSSVDQYGDSFARDLTTDNLHSILEEMKPIKVDINDTKTATKSKNLRNSPKNQQNKTQTEIISKLLSLHTEEPPGWVFLNTKIHLYNFKSSDINHQLLKRRILFGNGTITTSIEPSFADYPNITHVIYLPTSSFSVPKSTERKDLENLRKRLVTLLKAKKGGKDKDESTHRIPRIVGPKWIEDCWEAGTRVDEERYVVS